MPLSIVLSCSAVICRQVMLLMLAASAAFSLFLTSTIFSSSIIFEKSDSVAYTYRVLGLSSNIRPVGRSMLRSTSLSCSADIYVQETGLKSASTSSTLIPALSCVSIILISS